MKDLTTSPIDRQNILNNLDAVTNIQQYLGVSGMLFNGEYRFTKEQVADFYKIDPSTIDSYLSQYEKELISTSNQNEPVSFFHLLEKNHGEINF